MISWDNMTRVNVFIYILCTLPVNIKIRSGCLMLICPTFGNKQHAFCFCGIKLDTALTSAYKHVLSGWSALLIQYILLAHIILYWSLWLTGRQVDNQLQSYDNKNRTILTPITFEALLSGRNFTAPGSPYHANKTFNTNNNI